MKRDRTDSCVFDSLSFHLNYRCALLHGSSSWTCKHWSRWRMALLCTWDEVMNSVSNSFATTKRKSKFRFCRFDAIRLGTSRWRILTFLIIVFNRYGNKKDPKIIPKIKTAILIDDVLTTFKPRMNGGSGKYILIWLTDKLIEKFSKVIRLLFLINSNEKNPELKQSRFWFKFRISISTIISHQ